MLVHEVPIDDVKVGVWCAMSTSRINFTLCVPCIVSNYVNKTNKTHSFYIYLFYNLYIHSTCFERSYRPSSGVFFCCLLYSQLCTKSCKRVQSASCWFCLHNCKQDYWAHFFLRPYTFHTYMFTLKWKLKICYSESASFLSKTLKRLTMHFIVFLVTILRRLWPPRSPDTNLRNFLLLGHVKVYHRAVIIAVKVIWRKKKRGGAFWT